MREESISFIEILRRQFYPSFQMLANLIEACPERQWAEQDSGNPFWQRIMHTLVGIQFWLREVDEEFAAPDFGQGQIPDLDVAPAFPVTKQMVREYQAVTAERVEAFFSKMDDRRLIQMSRVNAACTYADIVIMQIRHIQHHVGYCNSLLTSSPEGTTKWLGYAE
jgi:DinB superfamily